MGAPLPHLSTPSPTRHPPAAQVAPALPFMYEETELHEGQLSYPRSQNS